METEAPTFVFSCIAAVPRGGRPGALSAVQRRGLRWVDATLLVRSAGSRVVADGESLASSGDARESPAPAPAVLTPLWRWAVTTFAPAAAAALGPLLPQSCSAEAEAAALAAGVTAPELVVGRAVVQVDRLVVPPPAMPCAAPALHQPAVATPPRAGVRVTRRGGACLHKGAAGPQPDLQPFAAPMQLPPSVTEPGLPAAVAPPVPVNLVRLLDSPSSRRPAASPAGGPPAREPPACVPPPAAAPPPVAADSPAFSAVEASPTLLAIGTAQAVARGWERRWSARLGGAEFREDDLLLWGTWHGHPGVTPVPAALVLAAIAKRFNADSCLG